MSRQVRVLVVDDSAVARAALARGLEVDPHIRVVGQACDPFEARDRIMSLDPEVMTLDIDLPRMDGVEFLRRLMPQRPIPTVVVSSLAARGSRLALDALEAGAVDVVSKPTHGLAGGLDAMLAELRTKVKIAATVNVAHRKSREAPAPRPSGGANAEASARIVAIGASTGGTDAIRAVLDRMPANAPGVVVVQHMPPAFTGLFASRLDETSAMQVREARDGDPIFPGRALIAPGGLQLRVERSGGGYAVAIAPGDKVSGHCPSVDVLFRSVALACGRNGVGALLTGMGADGAAGLLELRSAGGRTLAQDEASSVVWGMPRIGWENGGAESLAPIDEVADRLLRLAREER